MQVASFCSAEDDVTFWSRLIQPEPLDKNDVLYTFFNRYTSICGFYILNLLVFIGPFLLFSVPLLYLTGELVSNIASMLYAGSIGTSSC